MARARVAGAQVSDWDEIATPPLEEFWAEQAADSNFFWRIDAGHHLNLLDDASQRIELALALHAPHCVTCGWTTARRGGR